MKLTSERDQVRDVAARWKRTFCSRDRLWRETISGDTGVVHRKLCALNVETASAADVARIIGNPSWVKPWECRECTASGWDVVQLGDEPDYDSQTTYVCLACLRKAVSLAEGCAP